MINDIKYQLKIFKNFCNFRLFVVIYCPCENLSMKNIKNFINDKIKNIKKFAINKKKIKKIN